MMIIQKVLQCFNQSNMLQVIYLCPKTCGSYLVLSRVEFVHYYEISLATSGTTRSCRSSRRLWQARHSSHAGVGTGAHAYHR
jgi:hypothetical protein